MGGEQAGENGENQAEVGEGGIRRKYLSNQHFVASLFE